MLLANKDAYDPYRRSLALDCTTRFNNVEVASFAYTFDAGNRSVTRNADTFTYNVRDEILSAVIGTNRINHAYDTFGNHVFCAFNSATNFYANNQLNQTVAQYSIVSHGGTEPRSGEGEEFAFTTNNLTWSVQGGLQRDGRFVYAFDAEDQLLSATSSHLTNGAIRVVNAYDYRHRRISKTVYRCVVNTVQVPAGSPPSPASTTTWDVKERHDFVYDDWNLIHETVTTVDANSTTNVTEIEYFWGPDLSNTLQGAGGVGGLLAVSMNGVFYFPVYDNLGNIVKYLDENGNIVASYIYDNFGQMVEKAGPMAATFRFRFSTKYYEEETNLYYYGHRFYLPNLCCWLVRDPIEEIDSVNLYTFCVNHPNGSFDPTGMLVLPVDQKFGTVKNTFSTVTCPVGKDWNVQPTCVLFSEFYTDVIILKLALYSKCPTHKKRTTAWGHCCDAESCRKQADDIVEKVVQAVQMTSRKVWTGGYSGNIVAFVTASHKGKGCTDWQNLVFDSVGKALKPYKQQCFKGVRAMNSYKVIGGGGFDPTKHNWVTIIGPDQKYINAVHDSQLKGNIQVDPWPSGGGRLFPDKPNHGVLSL